MSLSIRILDPNQDAIVSVGHLEFFGNESTLKVKLQIIDLDQMAVPYYIPISSACTVTFPGVVNKIGTINVNRSIVTLTLLTDDVVAMYSGNMSMVITESGVIKTIQLGNCVRRSSLFDGSTSGEPTDPDDQVKTDSEDSTTGFLDDELIVGPNLIKEITGTGDKKLKISVVNPNATIEDLTNHSGDTIEIGRVVKITGSNSIEYADYLSVSNCSIAGITLEEILDEEIGEVITDGIIETTPTGVNDGDTLYLSLNGQIVNTPPTTTGTVIQKIGRFNSGKIYIRFELVAVN